MPSCSSEHEGPDLATCAGIMRGGPSRFAPVRTPVRTPATLRRFLATPMGARRSPARTPRTALSVGRGGLDSWLRRTGLAEVVCPTRPSCLAPLTTLHPLISRPDHETCLLHVCELSTTVIPTFLPALGTVLRVLYTALTRRAPHRMMSWVTYFCQRHLRWRLPTDPVDECR